MQPALPTLPSQPKPCHLVHVLISGLLFLAQSAIAQTGLIQFEGVLNGYIDGSGEPAGPFSFENHSYRATLEFDISDLEPSYSNDSIFHGDTTTYSGLPMQLAVEVLDNTSQVITTVTHHYDANAISQLYGANNAPAHSGLILDAILQSADTETLIQFNLASFTADYFNEYLPFLQLLDQQGSFPVDEGVFSYELMSMAEFLTGSIREVTTFYLHTCDEFSADGLDAPCDPLALQDYIGEQQALTDAAEAENRSLTKQLQLADSRYAALERQVQQLQASLASRDAQIAQLQQQKASLTANNANLQQQVSVLQASNAEQLLSITQLQQTNQSLQSQLDTTTSQFRALQRQNSNLQIARAKLQAEVADANQLLAIATARAALLEDTLTTADTATVELQSHLRDNFGDEEFMIGENGNATAALVDAIMDMNHGQQQALYRNLGGDKSKGKSKGKDRDKDKDNGNEKGKKKGK